MSSSNRGSSAARTDADEETNVDDVVNLATDADDSDDQNYFDSLRHSNPGKRNYCNRWAVQILWQKNVSP